MRNALISAVSMAFLALVCIPPAFSQESPVEKALQAPGARVTLPVTAAKEPFSKAFISQAQNAFNSFHAQMGGDHTLY